MAVIIERILQSSGLESAVSSIAPREMGITSDTERPVIGATVAGYKFIGTEELISIITPAPAAIPLLRRSRVMCFVDTNTAGANVALDITSGAQSAGYSVKVFVSGPDSRQAIVTYGSLLTEYIPAGMSQEFVWDGSKWNKTLMSWADRYELGSYIETPFDDTPDAKKAFVKVWDADHILDVANYPLFVPRLRAQKSAAWSGSAYVTDHTVTVAGSVITGSGVAWDAQLAAIAEDLLIHGSYSNYRTVNINGVDYAFTNVNAPGHTCTVSGSPATGTQTAIFYSARIAGSTTTARVYKDSGRVLMSQDGTLRIAGLRRRHHMQGHYHNPIAGQAGFVTYIPGTNLAGGAAILAAQLSTTTGSPVTDGTNGTPITGPENESNSTAVYRVIWAGVLI